MTSIMAQQIMGLVVGRQPLVVPGRAAVPGGPRRGPLDNPSAGQHLDGVEVIGVPDDLHGELEGLLCLGGQLAGV